MPTARTRASRITAALVAAVGLMACAPTGGNADKGRASHTLSLSSFSVAKAADSAIQKAYADRQPGEEIAWRDSFGASGDQSRAVARGLTADIVHYSMAPDVTRLVDAGLVAADWDQGPTRGVMSSSVVVLVVRPGNPKNITSFADLARPGIGVVTPNPGSSGSARWNVLAAYQSVIADGGTRADARAYLDAVFTNVKALPGSGRDATAAFQSGTGDVLLSYENEAIFARQHGEELDYIVPPRTLLIENPGAVTIQAHPTAQDFLEFATSAEGQQIYARYGFRPIASVPGVTAVTVPGANDPEHPFPTVTDLFTIDGTFGGWEAVNRTFFDEATGIITQAISRSGAS